MNKAKYVSPYDYDKEVKAWKKQKREAKKRGEIFEYPRPAKPKKMAERFLPLFFATLFFGYIAYVSCAFINILFPARMSYEYKSDIAKFKENNFDAYYFFPDEIPKDAENIEWIVLPSFMQGSGTEVLIFGAPGEYIQEVIAAYSQDAQICGIEEDMSFKIYYDETRLEKLTIYKIYDNDDRNHVHMWGFFVDDGISRIGFFSQ
ncbi:MAG: hypothetical protein J1E98_02235 [Lachnospiraceae bacterium]|nr:hypothetical protein [Lachnospiraceae bacterium]